METAGAPSFETEAGEESYRSVEGHGTAARHRVRDVTLLRPTSSSPTWTG